METRSRKGWTWLLRDTRPSCLFEEKMETDGTPLILSSNADFSLGKRRLILGHEQILGQGWSSCTLWVPGPSGRCKVNPFKLDLLILFPHHLVLPFNTGISKLICWDCHPRIRIKPLTRRASLLQNSEVSKLFFPTFHLACRLPSQLVSFPGSLFPFLTPFSAYLSR